MGTQVCPSMFGISVDNMGRNTRQACFLNLMSREVCLSDNKQDSAKKLVNARASESS